MGILSGLFNLVYPHLCPGCGDDNLSDKEIICFQCRMDLPYTEYHLHRDNKTEKVFYGRARISYGTSLLYFSKSMMVQNLLHEIKYRGHKELGIFMGKLMGRSIVESDCFDDLDFLVPLPLSEKKTKQRGYNQSELLCTGIAEIIQKPVSVDNVIRSIHTSTQTKKHRRERWQNVEGIFELVRPSEFENKHILLVDDVVTTGATLESCANEILRVSGVRVSIATLAIATK